MILFLHNKETHTAIIEEPVHNPLTGEDQDLSMKVVTDTGIECTVDPLNKWCAYAHHVEDVN